MPDLSYLLVLACFLRFCLISTVPLTSAEHCRVSPEYFRTSFNYSNLFRDLTNTAYHPSDDLTTSRNNLLGAPNHLRWQLPPGINYTVKPGQAKIQLTHRPKRQKLLVSNTELPVTRMKAPHVIAGTYQSLKFVRFDAF